MSYQEKTLLTEISKLAYKNLDFSMEMIEILKTPRAFKGSDIPTGKRTR